MLYSNLDDVEGQSLVLDVLVQRAEGVGEPRVLSPEVPGTQTFIF